jgi:ribonuclease HI
MPYDPRAIQIHTDGSAYRNPGHVSGCAVIARYPDHLGLPDEIIVDFGCAKSTNQRMELMACVEGLKWARKNSSWREGVTCVLVVTDSLYVTENIGRAPYWKKNGWRNLNGQPIANHDLWDDLLKARAKAGVRVDFVWQQGKQTDIGKRVDKLAKAGAIRGGTNVDREYKPGSFARSMVKGGVALPYSASGQIDVIRPYAKKIVVKGENRISFNCYDESTQTYHSKFYAFAPPLLSAELHRGNGHRVEFNAEPKYPQILRRIEGVQLPPPPKKARRGNSP